MASLLDFLEVWPELGAGIFEFARDEEDCVQLSAAVEAAYDALGRPTVGHPSKAPGLAESKSLGSSSVVASAAAVCGIM